MKLCNELAKIIADYKIEFDSICSPALGGILAGYELARACNKRFIFTERVKSEMTLRRGFEVKKGEKFSTAQKPRLTNAAKPTTTPPKLSMIFVQ